VLSAVPTSRLLLKTRGLFSPYTQSALHEQFAAHGIAADRVTCSEMVPDKAAHLGWYHRADVALDTFPYNGTTTTCEALWMGVPVVSLAGDRHASRVGLSLLSAAGLPELVARTEDEFVTTAAALAADPARRADLRATLRSRLQSSPLMDAPAHSARFFSSLRSAWRAWCHTH
jgi:predicted O-linked N-acetylglucosamine transferase (SPINDLY family)